MPAIHSTRLAIIPIFALEIMRRSKSWQEAERKTVLLALLACVTELLQTPPNKEMNAFWKGGFANTATSDNSIYYKNARPN